MGDDVAVVRDETRTYDDGTIARVRVLAVPESERYPRGIKYAMHYSEVGADDPIVRFDNHHGPHELHMGGRTWEIEFPGWSTLYETWRASLPRTKRIEW